jgi:DNA-binding NtrC family response regulator
MANLGFDPPHQPRSQWNASFVEQILLVESDPELRESRRLLLSSLRLPVHAVDCHLEVFRLLRENRYTLIVLGLLHDEEHASQVAGFVRANWPAAKILLLGRGCGHLDDWLYDDIVDPCCNPAGLIQSAQRLLEWARTGKLLR